MDKRFWQLRIVKIINLIRTSAGIFAYQAFHRYTALDSAHYSHCSALAVSAKLIRKNGGPAFYKQKRLTKDGNAFPLQIDFALLKKYDIFCVF